MENTPKRTLILWILGILTMIDTFFSVIAYLSWIIAPDYMRQSSEMLKNTNLQTPDQVEQMLNLYSSIQNWQYLLLILVCVALFAGAFLMLVKLKGLGFHVYTIGKITEFCVMNFVIGGMVAMDLNGVIMSVLWVLMYATQLRYLEPFDPKDNASPNQNYSQNPFENPQSNE